MILLKYFLSFSLAALVLSFTGCASSPASNPSRYSAEQLLQMSQTVTRKKENKEPCRGQGIHTAWSCPGDGADSEEKKLHRLVNEYRAKHGLPPIPLSPSLSLVANRHVMDLQENIGGLTHGWSNCPYKAGNRASYECMWNAPQRYNTGYSGNGYENAHGGTGGYRASAETSLRGWKGSYHHNNVILNRDIWHDNEWNALGVGIYGGFAVLWFGEKKD